METSKPRSGWGQRFTMLLKISAVLHFTLSENCLVDLSSMPVFQAFATLHLEVHRLNRGRSMNRISIWAVNSCTGDLPIEFPVNL